MRAPLLLAAVLVLAGCSNNDQTDNTQNVDENLTAQNIVSNDVTAIDAVTGDAANMAADEAVTNVPNAGDDTNLANPPKPRPQTVSAKSAPKSSPAAAPPAASNSTENAE